MPNQVECETRILVFARPIMDVHTKYRVSQRGRWSDDYVLLPANSICELIGIIDLPERVCIVQKHPMLASFAGGELEDDDESA